MKGIKLSVLVIARNEEVDLPNCLESVSWADEIIVINNNSTDKTASIAKKFGAEVFFYGQSADEGNFAKVRDFAASKAKGEWLLYVDADEKVTKKLQDEIESLICKVLPQNYFSAYAIPRRNILLGREMHHGGWWPDYVLRLIKKDRFGGYQGKLHEQPNIKGERGYLKNPLVHTTHKNLTEMVDKTNVWSEIEARLLFDSGHPPMNVWRFATAGFREFWYRAIRKLGFLDGTIGIIEIMYQTYSRLITYSKLWELQIKNESRNL